jgi:cytidylate kinase
MTEIPVITVDGPSGTGKGTVCSFLAMWLGWHLLDSGALYRILAHIAIAQEVSIKDEQALAELAINLEVSFQHGPDGVRVIDANAKDISDVIRTEECGNAASRIAALKPVREGLLQRQRDFLQAPGLVADGRDMGTVVFPDAAVKIYLTASADERAKRRHKQLNEKGINVNLPGLSADISERDARDKARSVSPLIPADDAIIVDSTELDIRQVCKVVSEDVIRVYEDLPALPSEW